MASAGGMGVSGYDKCVRFPMKLYDPLVYVAALSLTDCRSFCKRKFFKSGGAMLCI